MTDPFAVKDCALIAISTGEYAQNLREMRDRLVTVHPGCIYHHFWGGMLQPRFDEPEYMNDFAAWAWRGLHDTGLAERLALIDPTHYMDIEDLRRELAEVVEERLDESEMVPWSRSGQFFHFARSQIVVFDTQLRISNPRELQERIGQMSLGSVFYHFIDARRRVPGGKNDFSAWLTDLDEDWSELAKVLAGVDPYFTTLEELRRELEEILKAYPM
ncbi:MAG: hypothetical protein KBH99_10790 [Syntrophobacteraceae bacterium]|nr:hypothetical protein [Syntrophobacteraceae bacterium]